MPGSAFIPAAEAVRTIAPPLPPARIARIAACRVRKAPSRLTDEHPPPFGEAQLLDRPAGADAGIDHGMGEAGEVGVGPELLVGDVADHHLPLAGQREGEIAQPILVADRRGSASCAPLSASRVATAAPMPEAAPVMRTMALVKSGMAA